MASLLSGRAAPVRLSLFYAALFLVIGVNLPFAPSYLATKGMGEGEIGALLAAIQLSRVVGNPLIARAADAWGETRLPIIILCFASLIGFALFLVIDGFLGLFILSLALGLIFTAVMPLSDSLTLRAAASGGFDYGRVRLWGSLGFIVASTGAGWLIADRGAGLAIWLILAAWLLTLATSFGLPRMARERRQGGGGMLSLLSDRRFVLMLATSGCIQCSHSLLYAFGTIYWTAAGHSTATVGWLWAESVVAEILLFAAAKRIVPRVPPRYLFVAGGIGAVARWLLAASGTGLPLLIVVQLLHGVSFAMTHLGAMTFLSRQTPPGLAASAQVLHAVVVGSAVGLVTIGVGGLYEAMGGAAFYVMAGLAVPGAVLAILVAMRRDG
jgi:MFS transporter, PPP family, 3-phenylpropionic acid transporter